jgi:uncharacterized protein
MKCKGRGLVTVGMRKDNTAFLLLFAIMNSIQTLSQEFKEAMAALYGDRLAMVILYGSCARGTSTSDSDVDLAIILRDEFVERWREIERIHPAVDQLSTKYDQLISPIVLPEKRLRQSSNLFIQNIRREGITL